MRENVERRRRGVQKKRRAERKKTFNADKDLLENA
jgi:hypothetical protein